MILEKYDDVLKIVDHLFFTSKVLPVFYYFKARALYGKASSKNDFKNALESFEFYLNYEPNDYYSLIYKAACLRAMGLVNKAVEVYEKLKNENNQDDIVSEIIRTYEQSGKIEEAEQYASNYLQEHNSWQVKYSLAMLFAKKAKTIEELNNNIDVDGFIVQLPLPRHISEQKIIEAIDYRKDVDGFHPINVGRMSIGLPCYVSATPNGILELLKRYQIETQGKKCVVLGRSNIVGKPMAKLLLDANATVTIAHSRTKNLAEVCRGADILIAAVGRPRMITADMVRPGAIVIDVGVNRDQATGKLCGDVDFEAVKDIAAHITPVPGGVGPMTITMLMQNTIECFLNRMNK